LVDVVEKTDWDVLGYTTWTDVGSVETGTRNTLVEFLVIVSEYQSRNKTISYHQLLTLLETPQEGCQSTNIHSVGKNRHQVVQHSGDFTEKRTNPLCSLWYLDVQELLNSQTEALLVGHHRDVVQTVKVWQGLKVCLVLDELFCSTVQQSNVGVCANNLFSVELQNQSKDTVRCWMLWSEVYGVMSDLARVDIVGVIRRLIWAFAGVDGLTKVWVDWDQTSRLGSRDWLSIMAWERGREWAGGVAKRDARC